MSWIHNIIHLCDILLQRQLQFDSWDLDNYRHIAAFIIGKKSLQYLAIGENSCRSIYNGHASLHAEIAALLKLGKQIKYNKIKVNILVIRINRLNQLTSSKPCKCCIAQLYKFLGDRIKYVYYSTISHEIKRERFNSLLNDSKPHFSSDFRKKYR